MTYETTVHDYLANDFLMGQITTVNATVVDNNCDVVLTYSGCHALDEVALMTAVGCCHDLPATGTYTLTVEQTPDMLYSVSYSYNWVGVSGSIENVAKIGE
jgi:hypothetical protein